jgi:hypothetical protein
MVVTSDASEVLPMPLLHKLTYFYFLPDSAIKRLEEEEYPVIQFWQVQTLASQIYKTLPNCQLELLRDHSIKGADDPTYSDVFSNEEPAPQ